MTCSLQDKGHGRTRPSGIQCLKTERERKEEASHGSVGASAWEEARHGYGLTKGKPRSRGPGSPGNWRRGGLEPALIPSSTQTAALALTALKACRGDPVYSILEIGTGHSALESKACLWTLPFSLEVHASPFAKHHHLVPSLGHRQSGLGLNRGQAGEALACGL